MLKSLYFRNLLGWDGLYKMFRGVSLEAANSAPCLFNQFRLLWMVDVLRFPSGGLDNGFAGLESSSLKSGMNQGKLLFVRWLFYLSFLPFMVLWSFADS